MSKHCEVELRKKYALSEEQVQEIRQQVEDALEISRTENISVRQAIESVVNKRATLIQMAKNERLATIAAYKRNLAYADQKSFLESPVDALMTLLEPRAKFKYNGVGSMWTKKKSITDMVQSMIDQPANRVEGGFKRLASGDYDREIFKYVIDGDTNVSDFAKAMGEAYKKANGHVLALKRGVGSSISELENYLIKQSHNPEFIYKNEKAWKDFMLNRVDWDRAGFQTDDEIIKYLDSFYQKRKEELAGNYGYDVEIEGDMLQVVTSSGSKKMASSRSIHFKNADAAYDYFRMMNSDTSLYSKYIKFLDKDSSKIAAMEMFGPNYKMGYRSLKSDLKQRAFDLGEKPHKKFLQKEKGIDQMFNAAADGDFQGEMNWVARLGDSAMKITNMSRLGLALPTTITDFAFGAGVLSNTTGMNYSQALASMIKDTFFNFVSPKYRREVAELLQVFNNDVNARTMHTRFGEYAAPTSAGETASSRLTYLFDKMHDGYMRATGLPNQAVSAKLAISKQMSLGLGRDIGKDFNMTAAYDSLKKFGFTSSDWRVLQKSAQFLDDKPYITPQTIMGMTDLPFEKRLKLSQGLQEWMIFYAESGSPTTGLRHFAFKSAFDRNSIQGQAVRLFLQYKSFALSVFKSLETIRWTGAQNKYGNLDSLLNTMVVGTVFGAGALSAKSLLKGNVPEVPNGLEASVGFLGDSFLQSGAGTYWMDLMFQDYEKSYISLAGTLAGPVIGGIGTDFVSLLNNINTTDWLSERKADKRRQKLLRDTLIAIERNSPSIFFTKTLLNKNLYLKLHHLMNTGRRRAKRDEDNFLLFD